MTPQRYERLRECFSATCDLDDDAQREYLKDACAKDPSLSHDLERLLRADMTADGPFNDDETTSMERRTRFLRALEAIRAADEVPSRIGRYAIQRRIGSGGMGVVFEATQEQPQRSVAIKLLHLPLDSETAAKRFELEAQALALLHHPGIAQVFETGAADVDGRRVRYLAMEYVRGETILEYASQQGLDTDRRLELMARICDAVHHAHQKGVIHRDLKPGNIIVDEAGQPKILDFGVARITNGDIEGATAPTAAGDIIGTVAYMSPEQACGDPAEIDIRTDVYSLGVICFELLSGRSPYDTSRRQIHEAVRIICDDEPTRLSSIDRAFRGDIETLVGKAMEKEKERRYPSASEFAADIRRYLSDEPIVARPTTAWYQMRKFARRNRGLVAGVGVVLLLAAIGLAGTTAGFAQASKRARDLQSKEREANSLRELAEERAETARAAMERAESESRRWRAVLDFLRLALASADPSNARGSEPTIREAMDQAARLLTNDVLEDPLAAAEIHDTLAKIYGELGEVDEGEMHARAALRLREDSLPQGHVVIAESMSTLASILTNSSAAQPAPIDDARHAESRQLLEQAREIALQAPARHVETLLGIENNLASLLSALGEYEAALELRRATLKGAIAHIGETDSRTLTCALNLGADLLDLQHPDARTVLTDTLDAIRSSLGADHAELARALHLCAEMERRSGNLAEAVVLGRQAVELARRILPDTSPARRGFLRGLFMTTIVSGAYDEAIAIGQECLQMSIANVGVDHFESIVTAYHLGSTLRRAGEFESAVELLREWVGPAERVLGEDAPFALAISATLGAALLELNSYAEAEALLRASVGGYTRTMGPRHGNTQAAAQCLVDVLRESGQHSAANEIAIHHGLAEE